jgi:hypothetical protein
MKSEQAIIRVLGEAVATGRFIGVDFIKGDGSLRSMVCKVGPNALDRLHQDIVTVYDVRVKGYRSFNINSVVYLTHNDTNTFGF